MPGKTARPLESCSPAQSPQVGAAALIPGNVVNTVDPLGNKSTFCF
jgi:hypothetical protein